MNYIVNYKSISFNAVNFLNLDEIKALSEMNVESADYFNSVLGDIGDHISLSDGTFTYLIDLDSILENHNNGTGLAFVNGLGNFYKEKMSLMLRVLRLLKNN